jgi:hypothetical protein
MKRNERPHLSWLVEHLPDVVLFAVAVPVSLLSLLLHFGNATGRRSTTPRRCSRFPSRSSS